VSSLPSRNPQRRQLLTGLACASPILLLAAVWWLVNAVVLAPAVPDENGSAQQCVAFVVHERGLPRLGVEHQIAFVENSIRRAIEDGAFRNALAATLRRSAREEQVAFRTHVFDALKPRVLREIQDFHRLADPARTAWLEARLVDYKRLEMLLRTIRLDEGAFGDAVPDANELLRLVLSKTSEDERQLCLTYLSALSERANEILKEPELRRQFEQRLGFAIP
jgi:hypothetical protein